jgi:hypothetical protein
MQLESILPEYPSTLPADRLDDTSKDFPAFSFETKSFEGFFDRFNLCAHGSYTLEAIVIYSDSTLGIEKSFSDLQINSNLIRKTEKWRFSGYFDEAAKAPRRHTKTNRFRSRPRFIRSNRSVTGKSLGFLRFS